MADSQNYFVYHPRCELRVDDVIVKAAEKEGEEPRAVARFVGIISAAGQDFDGEDLDQDGLDWEPFMKGGWFNWEHQPGAENILGYPVSGTLSRAKDSEGNPATRVVGELLLHKPKAYGVWETASALQKSGSGRQIGFSIEGASRLRDPRNPKRVLKGVVRNVAITTSPKRITARLEMIKSFAEYAELHKAGEDGVGAVGYQTPAGMNGGAGDLSALMVQSIDRSMVPVAKKYTPKQLEALIKSRFPLIMDDHLVKAAEAFHRYLKARFPD